MNKVLLPTTFAACALAWPLAASAAYFSEASIDWSGMELGCVDTNPADGVPCKVNLTFTSFEVNANAGSIGDSDVSGDRGILIDAYAHDADQRAEASAGDAPATTRSYVQLDTPYGLATPYAEANTYGVVSMTGGYATLRVPVLIGQNTDWPPASHSTRVLFTEQYSDILDSDFSYASGFIERQLHAGADGAFRFHAQASSFLYVAEVPEPETYALLGLGLGALALTRKSRKA